jgi:predicted nucleic-acid-binding Zn-ribbon protein
MKRSGKCPKCGSQKIIVDAVVRDHAHQELNVCTYANPDALIFKEARDSTISAWICGECGFTELYTDAPQPLML